MNNTKACFFSTATLVLFVALFSSCFKMADCTRGFTTVSFINLSVPDTDTFYLRRYKLNTNLSVKIDTTIYRTGENMQYVDLKLDTLTVRTIDLNVSPFFIEAGYDYELVLPATGKVSRITDVIEENFKEKICGMARRLCYTSIRTAKVNGVTYSGSGIIKN